MAQMSNLPVAKFRNEPPGMRYRSGANAGEKSRWQARQQDSTGEAREAIKGWNEYFAGYQERKITTVEGSFIVLTKGSSDATPTDSLMAPWQILKLPERMFRIYPSPIMDGLGNIRWATWDAIPSTAETFFDIPLPETPASPLPGYIYLECAVDDTDDYHGILTSAAIKAGPAVPFLQNAADVVNIPLATYYLTTPGQYTLAPMRAFVFVLRRYGPPNSITWDCEPL